ncbi:MAG: hypothetical protein KF798_00480 [Candidatus Paracaedibacteraceae bacterium]|nr:hypothetical protein [Candidatus Paracaedibacteraceae bacterium]
MNWKKLGLVFKPEGQYEWMQNYASMPSALKLNGDLYRFYFSTRDSNQKAQVGFVEIDVRSPQDILRISAEPVLEIGYPGYFDDSGVYAGNILVEENGQLRMYYSGRNNGQPPLYYMSIGLANCSIDAPKFTKQYAYPIIARNAVNPWMVSTPCVVKKDNKYHMFYISGKGWDSALVKSFYDIKYAWSIDGLAWNFELDPILELRQGENNIAAPSVVEWKNGYLMFFSYVEPPAHYQIGVAFSSDLNCWQRLENPKGLELGPENWDSESMAYPHAFIHNSELYLLYSGNKNGLGGMGLAKLC